VDRKAMVSTSIILLTKLKIDAFVVEKDGSALGTGFLNEAAVGIIFCSPQDPSRRTVSAKQWTKADQKKLLKFFMSAEEWTFVQSQPSPIQVSGS